MSPSSNAVIYAHLHLLPFFQLAPASPGHPSVIPSICRARLLLLSASFAGQATPLQAKAEIYQDTKHEIILS